MAKRNLLARQTGDHLGYPATRRESGANMQDAQHVAGHGGGHGG